MTSVRRSRAGTVLRVAALLAFGPAAGLTACDRRDAPPVLPGGTSAGATGRPSGSTPGGGTSDPLRTGTGGSGRAGRPDASPWPVVLTDVTASSGLAGFRLHAGTEGKKNWLVESVNGGLLAFDADGDGDQDLLLPDGDGMSPEGDVTDLPGSGSRLYRNDGGFRFTDVTAGSGVDAVDGYVIGGAACDYDADGDTDVLLVGYDVLALLRNRGDGTFEDATAASFGERPRGLTSTACAFGDVDGDGRPDVYVGNYSDQRAVVEDVRAGRRPSARSCEWRGHKVFCGPRGLVALPNRLYLQRTPGVFTDVSATHLRETPRHSFQPVFTDVDGDGDLDVYVANDGTDNTLSLNDGRGVLTDRAVEAGVAVSMAFEMQGSMGVAVADYDRDGRMDIAVTNFAFEYNALYRNRTRPGSPPIFADVSASSRFCVPPHDRVCWGIGLRDFDADGVLDAYIAAGHVYPEAEENEHSTHTFRQATQMLRGRDGPEITFEDVSAASGPHFTEKRHWRGAVFPDLDDDGDPDVVVVAQHGPPAVLRNDSGPGGGPAGAWVRVDVRGPRDAAGRSAATVPGARVSVTTDDGTVRVAEVQCGSSFASSDDPRLLFGLGRAQRIVRISVRYPGGRTEERTDVPLRTTVRF